MFRQARRADLKIMARMEGELFGDLAYPEFVLRQLFDLHGRHWVVAVGETGVQGYAMVCVGADRCGWVMGLGVSSSSRGHGLGRALLDRAIHSCRGARVERVRITVRPDNLVAAELYKRAGFARIDYEEDYFGVGHPRDVLERTLAHEPRQWGGAEADDPRWIKHPSGPQP